MKTFVAVIEKEAGGTMVVRVDEKTLEFVKRHGAKVLFMEPVRDDDNYTFEKIEG